MRPGAVLGTAGGGSWSRTESGSYEEGLDFVSYADTGGAGLLVLVDPGLVEIGARHAVVSVAELPLDSPGYGEGPPVEEAVPAGMTTDPGEYADRWVRAWGAGAGVYGDSAAMYHFDLGGVGVTDWSRLGVARPPTPHVSSRTLPPVTGDGPGC